VCGVCVCMRVHIEWVCVLCGCGCVRCADIRVFHYVINRILHVERVCVWCECVWVYTCGECVRVVWVWVCEMRGYQGVSLCNQPHSICGESVCVVCVCMRVHIEWVCVLWVWVYI